MNEIIQHPTFQAGYLGTQSAITSGDKHHTPVRVKDRTDQGGRTWQAFGGGENGHETFRQARINNFRDKCVVFACNLKFSNLTQ